MTSCVTLLFVVVSYISLAALTSASREMDTLYTFDMATLATCTSTCTLHSMCTRAAPCVKSICRPCQRRGEPGNEAPCELAPTLS